jgi:hypothetical protein
MGERIKTKDGVNKYFLTMGTGKDEYEYEVPRKLFMYFHNLIDELYERDDKLDCLEQYGVDNWGGYEEAMAEFHRRKGDK